MGRQTSGILGTVKGRVGNVVGAQWKGTPYFRTMAIPSNPNTVAQQLQRSKMQFVVSIAKTLLISFIQPIWNPKDKNMSGYNSFVKVNIKNISDVPDLEDMVSAVGTLEDARLDSVDYSPVTGDVSVDWDSGIIGNGLPTDLVFVAVVDTSNKVAYVNSMNTRSAGTAVLHLPAGLTTSSLYGTVVATRGSGAKLISSNGNFHQFV